MDERRTKPGWAFWATILIVIAALYVLSIPPLFYCVQLKWLPEGSYRRLAAAVYAFPMQLTYFAAPAEVQDWIMVYACSLIDEEN